MFRSKELTPILLVPPASLEIVQQKERGGMGDVMDYQVEWYLFWLKLGGQFSWMWHRARLQWCRRGDVGWVPMAMAECAEFAHGDHVWHGPFPNPVGDVEQFIPCQQCIDKHNALARAQTENDHGSTTDASISDAG